jgi:hypothetical protein
MKKRSIILVLALVAVVTISGFTIINKQIYMNGTATAYTLSPHDGAGDCSICHGGGTATPVITFSATPAFGTGNTYVPGTVYTLSYNVSGYPKFGFDIELNAGNLTTALGAGTNVALTNCQVTPNPYSAGYPANVSHTAPIVSTSSATWHWTAPASGTVYIYSAGLGANGDGTTSGDKVATYTLILNPTSSSGINNYISNNFNLSFYPNPATESAHLTYNLTKSSTVSIKMYDIKGREVTKLLDETQSEGEQSLDVNVSNLSKGIYIVNLNVDGEHSIKKLIVQ